MGKSLRILIGLIVLGLPGAIPAMLLYYACRRQDRLKRFFLGSR